MEWREAVNAVSDMGRFVRCPWCDGHLAHRSTCRALKPISVRLGGN